MSELIKDYNFTRPVIEPIAKEMTPFSPQRTKDDLNKMTATNTLPSVAYTLAEFRRENVGAAFSTPIFFNRDLYKRYTDTFFGNSVFLDPRYYDNEEINARRQSELSKLAMGTIKAGSMFAASFGSFFTSAPWNYNNENTQALADVMEKWETLFPNFYTQEELQSKNPLKGFIPFVSTGWGNFWGDKLIKNIGFMAGAFGAAVVTDAAITGLTGGLGTVPAIAATTARLSMMLGRMSKSFKQAQLTARVLATGAEGKLVTQTAMKLPKALETMAAYSAGQRMLHQSKNLAMTFWAANAEASIEAVEGQRHQFEKMFTDFREREGRLPSEEEMRHLKQISTDAANVRYGMNLAVIWAANMVQWGTLFTPTKATTGAMTSTFTKGVKRSFDGGKTVLDDAGKAVAASTTKLGKVGKYLPGNRSMAIDNVSEGAQEMLQYGFEEASNVLGDRQYQNFIEGKYDPNKRMMFGDIVMSQLHGMKEAFTSKEGWEGFFIGFLTGYPVHGMTKGFQKLKGQKSDSKAYQEGLEAFNETSVSDLFMNTEELREMMERDRVSADEALNFQYISEQLEKAVESGDIFQMRNLKEDALINFVRTGVYLGKFDGRLVQLETLKNLEGQAFQDTFGLEYDGENGKNVAKANLMVDNMMRKAEQIKEVVETIDDAVVNPFDRKQQPKEWRAHEDMKDTVIRNTVLIGNMNQRIPNLVQDILAVNPNLTTDVLDVLLNHSKLESTYLVGLQEEIDRLNSSLPTLSNLPKSEQDRIKARKALLEKHVDKVNAAIKTYGQIMGKSYAGQDLSKLSEEEKAQALFDVMNFDASKAEAQTAAVREILKELLAYKISSQETTGMQKMQDLYDLSNTEGVLTGIIDLKRLQNAMSLLLDQNNSFQTAQGRKKAVEKYVGLQKDMEDNILAFSKRAAYKEFLKNPVESSDALREENAASLQEVDVIDTELKQLRDELKAAKEQLKASEAKLKQLLEDNTLNPELQGTLDAEISTLENQAIPMLQARIAEIEENIKALEQRKAELLQGVKEREQVIDDLAQGNPEPTTEETPSTTPIVEAVETVIVKTQALSTDLIETLRQKIKEASIELKQVDSNNTGVTDTLLYLQSILEESYQRESALIEQLRKEISVLQSVKYVKGSKKEAQRQETLENRISELRAEIKKVTSASLDIHNRIQELQENLKQDQELSKDLRAKIEFYNTFINQGSQNPETDLNTVEKKLEAHRKTLDVLNKKIERTETYIDKLKKLLKELVDILADIIPLFDNYRQYFDEGRLNLAKVDANYNPTTFKYLTEQLETMMNVEELTADKLQKAEARLERFREKAIKLQNEIRFLEELLPPLIYNNKLSTAEQKKSQQQKSEVVTAKETFVVGVVEELQKEESPAQTPKQEVKETQKKIDEAKEIESQTDLVLENIETRLSTEEVLGLAQTQSSPVGSVLFAYSYLKTTQFENSDWATRRLNKSGIFEEFLKIYESREGIQQFLQDNNLSLVLMRVPNDQNLFDDNYFDKGYEAKEDDVLVGIVYNDSEGKPTNTLAYLNAEPREISPGITRTSYEVIPMDTVTQSSELPKRGQNEDLKAQGRDVRTVSILQSVPRQTDKESKQGMANARIQVGRDSDMKSALKHVEQTQKELEALRNRIATQNEIIPIFIDEVTVGANKTFKFISKPTEKGLPLDTFETEQYAQIDIPMSPNEFNGFQTFGGHPYVRTFDESGTTTFMLPVQIPSFTDADVKIGGKSVLENLADILFVLQNDFENSHSEINTGLNKTASDMTVAKLFQSLIYKPKKDGKGGKIVIKRTPLKSKDKEGNTVYQEEEWMTIAYNFTTLDKPSFFEAKRYRRGQSSPTASLRLQFSGEKAKDFKPLSRAAIQQSMVSLFRDVKLNVSDQFLRPDDKRKSFGYVNVRTKEELDKMSEKKRTELQDRNEDLIGNRIVGNPESETSFALETFSTREEPLNYIKTLSQWGATVPATFMEVPGMPKRQPNEPFSRIGKGIIFSANSKEIEDRLEEEQQQKVAREEFQQRQKEAKDSLNKDIEDLTVPKSQVLAQVADLQSERLITPEEAQLFRAAIEGRKESEAPTTTAGVIVSEQSQADRLLGKEPLTGKTTSTESTSNQAEIKAKIADIERRRGLDRDIEDYSKRTDLLKGDFFEGAYYHKNGEYYDNPELDSFDLIKGSSFKEVDDLLNDKYDAEYVDAVKKGEMTKEQAMQALEEAGRKDSKAYTELKALGQQVSPQETPVVETPSVLSINPSEVSDNSSLVSEPIKEEGTQEIEEQDSGEFELSMDDLNNEIDKIINSKSSEQDTSEIEREWESSLLSPRIEAPEISQEDIDRVKAIFGNDVNINQLSDVVNSNAWATWSKAGITLYKGSNRSDLYHEAWHNFSQLYLTKAEKTKLYNEVRDKISDLKTATDLQVEEFIAREFSKFAIEDSKYDLGKLKETKSIFKKIWNFLKKLFGFKNNNLENLFDILYKGNIQNYKPSVDNIMQSQLNSEINSNFTLTESQKIADVLDGVLGHVLRKRAIPLNYVSKLSAKNLDLIYSDIDKTLKFFLESQRIPGTKNFKPNGIKRSTNLLKILKNWEEVKAFHFQNSELLNRRIKVVALSEDGEFVDTGVDESLRQKNSYDDNEASTKSFYDVADPEIIETIRLLPEVTTTGSLILDKEYGTPKLVDAPVMINIILEELAGTLPNNLQSGKNNAISKLRRLSQRYPTISKNLLPQILSTPEDGMNNTKFSLKMKFFKAFTRPRNPIRIISVGRFNEESNEALSPSEYSYNNAIITNSKFSVAAQEVRTEFFMFEPTSTSLVTQRGEEQENVILNNSDNINKLGQIKTEVAKISDPKLAIAKLDLIGINSELVGDELSVKDVEHIFEVVQQKLKDKKDGINDIVTVLQSPELYPEFIKMLRTLVQKDPSKISNAFFNADGKLENEITQWSRLNFVVAAINSKNYQNYSELVAEPEFSFLRHVALEHSNLLGQYFHNNPRDKATFGKRKLDVKKDITAFNKNGLVTKKFPQDPTQDGTKTRKLHVAEAAISDIQSLFTSVQFPTMQMADKSSFFAFEINELFYKENKLISSDLYQAFKHLIQSEIALVRTYREQLETSTGDLIKMEKLGNNIRDKEGRYQFGIFKDIFKDKELVDELINSNFDVAPDVLVDKLKTKIGQQLHDYFNSETKATIKFFNDMTSLGGQQKNFLSHIKVDGYTPENAVAAYVVNSFLMNVETANLIYGNTYSHKDPFKRISGGNSTKTPPIMDVAILKEYEALPKVDMGKEFRTWFETEFLPQGERLDIIKSKITGTTLSQEERRKQTRFVVFDDVIRQGLSKSPYRDEYTGRAWKEINFLKSRLETESLDSTKRTRIENKIKELEAKVKSIESVYNKVNEADAFGFMSMDFFRKTSMLMGSWNVELNKIYDKISNWGLADIKVQYYEDRIQEASDNNNVALAQELQEKRDKQIAIREANALNETEIGKVELTVQKFQYFGDVLNDSYHEVAFHKFELMPLIPQLVSGTQLQKHAERMLLEDIDYALFDSGNKLEKDKNKDKFYSRTEEVRGKEKVSIQEVRDAMSPESIQSYRQGNTSYNIRTGNLMYLGEQVKMDTKPHGEDILFGTQIRVLVFNYFNRGKADIIATNGEQNESELNQEIEDLFSEYKDVIKELTQIELDRVFKQMSLNPQTLVVQDKEKFLEFLKSEMKNKTVSQNAYEHFALNAQKEFSKDIDLSSHKKTLENIVISVLNKRLISQRMKGEQKVQVPSTGFQSYRPEEVKVRNLENGTNGLRCYYEQRQGDKTVVRKMQVKIALKGEFLKLLNLTHSDGNPIKTRARLNEEIRSGKIDMRAITLIGYRIPTQEHNSIEVMEVAEFLDPLFGSAIIVPSEITAKAGSDFDIDKMNTFYPNLGQDGSYLNPEQTKRSREQLEALEQERQEMLELVAEMKAAAKEERAKLNKTSERYKELSNVITLLSMKPEDIMQDFETDDDNRIIMSVDTVKKMGLLSLRENMFVDEQDRKNIIRNYKQAITDLKQTQQFILDQYNLSKETIQYFYSLGQEINNVKSGLQNRVVEIIEQAVLNPSNLTNLITPNGTFIFDDTASQLIKELYGDEYWDSVKDQPNFDVKLTKMFSPLENYKKFMTLLEQKQALGITAKNNVFSQLLRQADVQIEGFESSFVLSRTPGGNIALGQDTSVAGQNKAAIFGQTINYNVDAANSPIFAYLNTGLITAPVMMAMHQMGVNPEVTLTFVNTPTIRKYANDKKLEREAQIFYLFKKEGGKDVRIDAQVEIERDLITKLKNLGMPESQIKELTAPDSTREEGTPSKRESILATLERLNSKDSSIEVPLELTKEFLIEHIRKDKAIERGEQLSTEQLTAFYLTEILLFDEFLNFNSKAELLKMLQDAVTYDTKKTLTTTEAKLMSDAYAKVLKTGQFTNVDRLRFDSVTSPFAIQDMMVNTLSNLMPVTNSKVFIQYIVDKIEEVFEKRPASFKERFIREFTNGIVPYIFQSQMSPEAKEYLSAITKIEFAEGKSVDQNLRDFHKGFYKTTILLKKNRPDLFEKYSLLRNMFINASSISSDVKNVGIVFPSKDTKVDNEFINQWKELTMEEGQIIPSSPVSNTNIPISTFMEQLALFGFLQSGLNFSYLSFTRVISSDVINDVLALNKQEFLQAIETWGAEVVYEDYFQQFMKQNNRFRLDRAAVTDEQGRELGFRANSARANTYGMESFRGQFYKRGDYVELAKKVKPKQNIVTPVLLPSSMSEFINHSGGAAGSDTYWDIIGREFGVINHKHYRDSTNQSLSKQLRNKGVKAEVLSKEQMDKARLEVKKLLGKKYPDTTEGNLQVRNYYQVVNSDGVFAIAKLNVSNDTVSGGTNTAVQLGIKLGKPVYVWDINTEQWYSYERELEDDIPDVNGKKTTWEGFIEWDTPTLTRNFAGVGSRDIENYQTKNKETGKWEDRKEYVGKEKEEKAKQAIRDVYEKTLRATTPTQQPKVDTNVTNVVYTKQTANDKTQGFFFTENLQAYLANRGRGAEIRFDLASSEVKLDVTATNNQAGIRRTNGVRNLNAFAIISKKFQQNGKGNFVQEEGQFQDTQEDFDLFKKYNLEAIEEALNSKLPLNILAAGIATGKAALPLRFAEWLNETLKEKLQVSGTIKENPTKGYKGYGIYDIVSAQQSQTPQVAEQSMNLFTTKIDQFTYTYNPQTGQIIHNAKAGDKIETNETQIGKVLAAYAKQENLPTKEFNKQLYVKIGNRIININNGNTVTQKQIQALFEETFATSPEVLSVGEKPRFEYNQEQKSAIQSAIDFIEKGDSKEWFLVQGKAGTGKTTIAQEIAKKFSNKSIVVAALSNKAKKVIQDKFVEAKLNARFYSVAGLLGQTMDLETGKFERKVGGFDELSPPIEEAEIIIIDEASMINEQALEMIMTDKLSRAKVIFLGDIGQLPPIRTTDNPYYSNKQNLINKKSPVFEGKNIVKLEERVRQGEESPILPFADIYWENSQKSSPVLNPATSDTRKTIVNNKGALIFTNSFTEIKEGVVDSFRRAIETNNPNLIKVVSYRNDVRREVNSLVHSAIFGNNSPEFNKGELLIFNDTYGEDFENADEVQIFEVSDVKTSKEGLKYVSISVAVEDGVLKSFPVLLKDAKVLHTKLVSEAFDTARKAKGSLGYKTLLKEAWALKRRFANVDYAYAITSHKSQGSTYDIVIVHEKDIMSVGATTPSNKSESVYTALTRPRNVAVVISTLKVETQEINIGNLNDEINKAKGLTTEQQPSSPEESQEVPGCSSPF